MASKKNSKLNAKEAAKRAPAKYKLQQVKKLAMLIDENKTIMFASIKSLPTKQFQKIKKNLEKEVFFIVAKKNITTRAIESSKKQNIHELKDHIKEDNAILISQMDAFDLAGKLAESKSPVKAKVGQIAEMDIHIEPGPTELVAGPVVSELGALGLKIEIKGGKIEIKEAKIIVKKGQAISEAATNIMGKLNILPFSVGFIPLVAYDSQSNKIYTSLIIDKKETLIQMKNYFAKAKAFAVLINYISKDTIGFLLAKAASHERAIESIINVPQTETKSEEKSE
ncbi:50S ribosomal protein L10 [Candidatus Pacearchaeota archaeon]|nr:50S ribosomal protein L10 [Candidatus Pacearchaeota archaeon]